MQLKTTKIALCASILLSIFSFQLLAEDRRLYKTSPNGVIQYTQPSLTIKDNGRVIINKPNGARDYDKDGFKIEGNRIYPTDKFGRRKYGEDGFTIEGNNIRPTDKYGRRIYSKDSYQIKDNRIYPTDKYGRRLYSKDGYTIK